MVTRTITLLYMSTCSSGVGEKKRRCVWLISNEIIEFAIILFALFDSAWSTRTQFTYCWICVSYGMKVGEKYVIGAFALFTAVFLFFFMYVCWIDWYYISSSVIRSEYIHFKYSGVCSVWVWHYSRFILRLNKWELFYVVLK